ncbi:MAG: YggT family protein [Pseudomonadales bacterium]|uniref:Putative integral membrane protein n=1 Tax=Oleiphilus messinensis TaxID=141451 RepID=A0A1Y0I5G7_9GAMM|nr:YggT family protein [Oleiphilus messinensis]ARU55036.1 putative integral membrane protein [Oleiphilus messinensis]MCG8609307.1 YggT family protein [Pseudomonadales bacterium]
MLAQILISTLQILSAFYLTIVLLRFLLQVARADFYNPISQFVVKATNPLLIPLRRIVPSIGGVDTSSLLLALLIQTLVYFLIILASGQVTLNPIIFAWAAVTILGLILKIYFWSIIAVIILSWVAQGSYHPAVQLLHQLTEPVMAPFRKLIPPIGGLDLSPLVVFLVINVLDIVVNNLAIQVGLGRLGVMF